MNKMQVMEIALSALRAERDQCTDEDRDAMDAKIAEVEAWFDGIVDVVNDHDDKVVERAAPRWAWDVIDETIVMDSRSGAFDTELRAQIGRALAAMVFCSEYPETEVLSQDALQEAVSHEEELA